MNEQTGQADESQESAQAVGDEADEGPSDDQVYAHNKQAILEKLKALGIKRAVVEYAGSGDSGDTMDFLVESPEETSARVDLRKERVEVYTDVTCRAGDALWYEKRLAQVGVEDAALALCNELIEKHHGGYENDEGGGGTLTFDTDKMALSYEKRDYYLQEDVETVEV